MVIQVGGGQLQMAFRSAPSQVFQHRQGCSLRHDKAEPFELTLAFCTSLETRKVVAKIALASIAHQYGVSYALSPQFDHLRQVRAASATSSLDRKSTRLNSSHPSISYAVFCLKKKKKNKYKKYR